MASRAAPCLILLLLCGLLSPSVVAEPDTPTIERVEPNPVTTGNTGEYIVVAFPTETDLQGWSLTDGTHSASLPNRTVSGEVALTASPRYTTLLTDMPIVAWSGHLPLSADGDRISLVDPAGESVDTFAYGRTPARSGWIRADSGAPVPRRGGDPVGPFAPRDVEAATTFVLPDEPSVIDDRLRTAEERIWMGGYEFTDPVVESILLERHAAGVDVRIVLDGRPVGGQETAEPAALDRLSAAGIPVRVLDGERRRYRYYHPKYAVVDDTAIVLSENWKPAGIGGTSSRGWGVAIDDDEVAADLAAVFEADAHWRDGVAWSPGEEIPPHSPVDPPMAVDHHPPDEVVIDRTEIVVGPYETEPRLLELIANAEHRIDIQQVRISDPAYPLLDAAIRAAERGVTVRIHLDATWYVHDENVALASYINDRAEREGLPIEARVDDPAGRYEKVHNKGMIVDDDVVVVGSMNWNNVSMRENREVLAILESQEAATYYREVFEKDWSPPGPPAPVGYLAITAGLWIVAGLVAYRRIAFDQSSSGT